MNNINVTEYDDYVDPLDRIFKSFDKDPRLVALDEVSYKQRAERTIFSIEVLDVDRYIKVNELQPITNPTFFGVRGAPTSDGLLSNEIFGITQKDRAGTFAYINLYEYFLDPSCYKTLCKLDGKFKRVIAGLSRFKIVNGKLVEDPNGGTGIKWLKENFSKFVFEKTDSRERDMRIRYINHNYKLGRMFINKYIVIPAFYRDVNTTGRHVGVGEINTLYVHLITSTNALKENGDYGLSIADATCYKIQETIRTIYDWFCGNNNENIKDPGTGLSGKHGIIQANLNYTSDYSSRLVLTAPELKAETLDDLMITLDKSALPLAAVVACFFPFVLYHLRKFFENEFLNVTSYPIVTPKGELKYIDISNAMKYFTDDILKDQLSKFSHSQDTRFTPIEIPTSNDISIKYYMRFKGKPWKRLNGKQIEDEEAAFNRPLTWTDVIFMAAKRASEGKQMAFTRYPIDSYFNTIYTGIEVASTLETEQIVIDGEFYRFYPKIRLEDIGKSTESKFVDTMRLCNLYLEAAVADYDGDTGQVKGSFFKETNEEIKKFRDSKANYIDASCTNNRVSNKEAVQALYNFTLVLRDDKSKLVDPIF